MASIFSSFDCWSLGQNEVMPLARASDSVLLLIDLQPSFLKAIHGGDALLRRSEFLLRIAALLEIPIIATEQNPERMGGTDPGALGYLTEAAASVFPKMTFSCHGCPEFDDFLPQLNKNQVVVCGIETHICLNQTMHYLMSEGYEVLVAADAAGASSEQAHQIGLKRLRHAGATVAHSESIAYEWMGTAEHPLFRDALKFVKAYAAA